MEEPVVEKTDPVVEPVKEKNESVVENEPTSDPKPKSKGGRPAGSKDKVQRTRRKITVVEEPLKAPHQRRQCKNQGPPNQRSQPQKQPPRSRLSRPWRSPQVPEVS